MLVGQRVTCRGTRTSRWGCCGGCRRYGGCSRPGSRHTDAHDDPSHVCASRWPCLQSGGAAARPRCWCGTAGSPGWVRRGRAGRRRVVELGGALVTPAFVDAHVHATDTGLALSGLDLSSVRSARECWTAVAAFAAASAGGRRWCTGTAGTSRRGSDQRPPSADELDRAARGRRVYLSQASVHSALVSAALLAACAGGGGGAGVRRVGVGAARQAHHVVRAVALGSLTVGAAGGGAADGVGAGGVVGDRGGARVRWAGDVRARRTSRVCWRCRVPGLPQVFGYWGELMGAAKARELGAVGAGGDLYADGALGSRTAHVSSPYLDGRRLRCRVSCTAEQVTDAPGGLCRRRGCRAGSTRSGTRRSATVLDGFAACGAPGGGGPVAGRAGTGSSTWSWWTRR